MNRLLRWAAYSAVAPPAVVIEPLHLQIATRTVLLQHQSKSCQRNLHVYPAGADAAEDDGYLITFVYDESTDKSDFVVFDAKTMSSTPLATLPLPVRVPHGFHGLWVDEQELKGAE